MGGGTRIQPGEIVALIKRVATTSLEVLALLVEFKSICFLIADAYVPSRVDKMRFVEQIDCMLEYLAYKSTHYHSG